MLGAMLLRPGALILCCVITALLVACTEDAPSRFFTNDDWGTVVADPGAYEGSPVELTAKVFGIERTDSSTALYVWADARARRQESVVTYADPELRVDRSDYVRVLGTVGESVERVSTQRGERAVPTVVASSVKVVGPEAATAPPHTRYARSSATQAGVTVTVAEVAATPDETRAYIAVVNRSPYEVTIRPARVSLSAGGARVRQHGSGDYPRLPPRVGPGARSRGVLVFDPVPPDAVLRLLVRGASETPDEQRDIEWLFRWG